MLVIFCAWTILREKDSLPLFCVLTTCVCALFVKMSRHTLYEHKRKCAKCNITAAEDRNLSFHRFPLPGRHTMLKARVWAEYCYPTGEWSTEKSLRDLHSQHKMLCSKHFDDSSFTSSARIRLNNYAIPIGTQDLMVKFRQEQCATTSGSEQDTNISVEKPQVLVTMETLLPVQEPTIANPTTSSPVPVSTICKPTTVSLKMPKTKGILRELDLSKSVELSPKKLKLYKKCRRNLSEIMRLRKKKQETTTCPFKTINYR